MGWADVCRQVALFSQTAGGFTTLMTKGLELPRTMEGSVKLLEETRHALELLARSGRNTLPFHYIYEIEPAVAAARRSVMMTPLQHRGVLRTLESCVTIFNTLSGEGQLSALVPCSSLVTSTLVQAYVDEVSRCLDGGRLADTASENLAAIRSDRRENKENLRIKMDQWAQDLFQKGVCERQQVVIRRGRLCVPVRAGRQGDVCSGSVVLAQSSTGSTFFVEPGDVVQLNNDETELEALEQEEEERILTQMTSLLATAGNDALDLLKAVTRIDIACTWHGAVF